MCNTLDGIHYSDDQNLGFIIGIVIGGIAVIVIVVVVVYYRQKKNQGTV